MPTIKFGLLTIAALAFLLLIPVHGDSGLGFAQVLRDQGYDGPTDSDLAESKHLPPNHPDVVLPPNNPRVSSHDAIALAQKRLTEQGFYHGPIDGQWNSATIKAIKKFQDDEDLVKTGRLDMATSDSLGLNIYTVSYDGWKMITYNFESPEVIAYTQRALRDEEYYKGPIDGELNAVTRAALENFQRDMELPITGRLDETTARALRLKPITSLEYKGEDF